jgi:hypothetical protein
MTHRHDEERIDSLRQPLPNLAVTKGSLTHQGLCQAEANQTHQLQNRAGAGWFSQYPVQAQGAKHVVEIGRWLST